MAREPSVSNGYLYIATPYGFSGTTATQTPMAKASLRNRAAGAGPSLKPKAASSPSPTRNNAISAIPSEAPIAARETVNALIVADASIGAKESQKGETALMWAAAEGNREVVERLIEQGADKNRRWRKRMSKIVLVTGASRGIGRESSSHIKPRSRKPFAVGGSFG